MKTKYTVLYYCLFHAKFYNLSIFRWDLLEIYDGEPSEENSTMILKVAESSVLALENNNSLSLILNTTISSSSNKVMIRFQSDRTISRKGFKIHFNRGK